MHPTGAVGESGVKLACARGPGDSPCLRSSRHESVWTVNQGLDGVLTNRPAAPDHKGSLDRQIADGVGVRVAVPGRRTAGQWRRLTHVKALVTAPRSESRWRVRARRSAFTVGRRRQRARSVIPRPDGRGMRNDIDGMLHACRLPSDGRRTACHRGVSGRTRQRQYGRSEWWRADSVVRMRRSAYAGVGVSACEVSDTST